MLSPFTLLYLLWCPWLVLGGYQVIVSTNGAVAPGDIVSYGIVADPLPASPLGMVLIPVRGSDPNAPRVYTPWTVTMSVSPQQFSVRIPTGLANSLYTIDAHQNSSVYSPLLASSNAFQIASPSTPSSSPPPVTTTTTQAPVAPVAPITTTTQAAAAPQSPSSQVQAPPVDNSSSKTQTTAAPATPTGLSSINGASSTGSSSSLSSSSSSSDSTSPSGTPASSSANTTVSGTSNKSGGSVIGAAVGGAIGGILLLLLALFFWRRHRRRRDVALALGDERPMTPYDPAVDQTSPFSPSFTYRDRPFSPNRGPMTQVSPFVVSDVERQTPSLSDPSTAKSREAFANRATHVPGSSMTSSGYMDSLSTGVPQDQLRHERERLLGEISALRSGTGQQHSWSGSSAAGTDVSGRDQDDSSEIRNRLDQLTQHVRRLETALEHAYDAPPTYV
ncbi:hypothetical protein BDZ97DRAFT_1836972 [Flammula alnicola]|nr:hypothetical protein BDZ97DRAFT_1836972 [Flammula alnicola]